MTTLKKQHIAKLVKEYSRNSGTEALIGFVADTTGMLAACQFLLQSIDAENTECTEWLLSECNSHDVELYSFLEEIERIIALFHPGRSVEDHYATLGVPDGAGPEEIKKAYRGLSLRYHPDTASPEDRSNPDKFLKITEAYHSLIVVGKNAQQNASISSDTQVNNWRREKERSVSTGQRKKVFVWVLGLLTVLVLISIIASINYKKRAMIAGLQESKPLSVAPVTVLTVETPSRESEITTNEENYPLPPPETTEEKNIAPLTEKKITEEVIAGSDITDSDANISEKEQSEEKSNILVVVEKSQKTLLAVPSKEVETNKKSIKEGLKDRVVPAVAETEADIDNNVVVTESQVQDTPLPESKSLDVVPPGNAVNTDKEIIQETDLGGQVDSFVADYIKAYEQRSLILFSRLFEADAVENGKPFASMLPTYIDLFAATSDLILNVDIISWEESDASVDVRGRFKVYLQYKDSREISGSGPIRFLLNDSSDGLRIMDLQYDFNIE